MNFGNNINVKVHEPCYIGSVTTKSRFIQSRKDLELVRSSKKKKLKKINIGFYKHTT